MLTNEHGGLAPQPQPEHNQAPLVALDAQTGAVLWRVCPGPWAFSNVTVIDDVVLVRGRAFQFAGGGSLPCGQPVDPVLLALSAYTGAVVWASDDQRAWAYYEDPPTPDVSNDVVVVADHETVRALAPTSGDEQWAVPGGFVGENSRFVAVSGAANPVRTIDRRSGAPIEPPAPVPPSERAHDIKKQTALTATDGAKIEITPQGAMYTDASGRARWTVPVPTFTTEVRGISPNTVFLAGAVRTGNCA